MFAVILAAIIAIPLLALVTFVQLLCLESLRLRTRDLPALKFFKDTLEDKLGFHAEQGAGFFSLFQHGLLVFVGALFLSWLADGAPLRPPVVFQAILAAWIVMLAFAYALPQLFYRRTQARWLLPFIPLLRGIALMMRPFDALMSFFQSLVEL